MPLEIRCPGCGRLLRVGSEHAGKQIRCPACQRISSAPLTEGQADGGSVATNATAVTDDSLSWHMRTPEGQTYGPISWRQVEQWASEGRIASDCQLSSQADGPWEPARHYFPELRAATSNPTGPEAPTTYPWASQQPFAATSPVSQPIRAGGFVTPHRGGLILALGLLGLIIGCPVFSLMAWIMGSHDLGEIRAGRMDPTGHGLTQVGYILGLILSLLTLFSCGLAMLIAFFAAIAATL